MTTIYEVAQHAQVSTATISKVLSGKGYISAATKERVYRSIKELGYVPSQRAQALSKGRSLIIGLLIPYDSEQFFDDQHLLACMRGVEQIANQHDYNLLLSTARAPDDAVSACSRLLRGSVIDGAIVIETSDNPLFGEALSAQQHPWVAIGYPLASQHCVVHADDRVGAQDMAEHLLALGHQRIGAIISTPRPQAINERLQGVRAAFNDRQLVFDEALVDVGDFSEASGYAAAQRLLRRPHRPSAIFAFNDRMAFGVLRCAQELGLRVPHDLSVAGFDDIPPACTANPPLTTVRQPGVAMGQAAAQALFALIDEQPPVGQCIVPTQLMVRQSTAHWKGGVHRQHTDD